MIIFFWGRPVSKNILQAIITIVTSVSLVAIILIAGKYGLDVALVAIAIGAFSAASDFTSHSLGVKKK